MQPAEALGKRGPGISLLLAFTTLVGSCHVAVLQAACEPGMVPWQQPTTKQCFSNTAPSALGVLCVLHALVAQII